MHFIEENIHAIAVAKVNKQTVSGMSDGPDGIQRERKRSAKSPLESINSRRKLDKDMEEETFVAGTQNKADKTGIIKDRLRSSGKERDRRSDVNKSMEGGLDKSMESHMRGMVASLNNLEQLYSQLDGKIRKVRADLGKRLYKLNLESREKFEKFENFGRLQTDSDQRIGDLQTKVEKQNTVNCDKFEYLGQFQIDSERRLGDGEF